MGKRKTTPNAIAREVARELANHLAVASGILAEFIAAELPDAKRRALYVLRSADLARGVAQGRKVIP